VHWAHRITDRFPGGQLYADLRGFDPAGTAVSPAEALHGFLPALGVTPDRVPEDLAARTALYRTRLAGQRVLVVLDNARDPAQVRPLLPGTPGCLAVVTSRQQLTSLTVTENASPLILDLMAAAEARDLLTARLGGQRAGAEPGAVDEIVTLCARLPLALAIAAARAAARPRFTLAELADELRAARPGLDALAGDDPTVDPRAVFSWFGQALRRFEAIGDDLGQARSHASLGWLAGETGSLDEAQHHAGQATSFYQAAGYRPGEARSLNDLGWYHALRGDYEQALTFCEQALEALRETGERGGRATAMDSLGYIHHQLGNHDSSIAYYQDAIGILRDLGDRLDEADTLRRLGDVLHGSGDTEAARRAWLDALHIYDEIDHPNAAEIRAKLQPPGTQPESSSA